MVLGLAAEAPMKIDYPYLVQDTDRHGNVRYYYRRKGKPKVRITAEPGTPQFLDQYTVAHGGKVVGRPTPAKAGEGSFWWLCQQYFKSPAFKLLGKLTQHRRRGILEGICQSRTPKGKLRGDAPAHLMEEEHVREIRDERADKPGSANNALKAISTLFTWAKEAKLVKKNPVLGVKRFGDGEGFHTWTDEEIQQFEDRHPIGTKARLAFALIRYVGVRRSDVVKLGKGMEGRAIDDSGNEIEVLRFTVTKGSQRKPKPGEPAPKPKRLELPILPELRAIIDATPSTHMTYFVTSFGKPFSVPGFGNKFREWCDQAGLPHCAAHGIRKYDATTAAENGATEHQLMGMFGWDDPKQAATYTRKARQKKLARSSMHLIAAPEKNKKVG